MKPAKKALKTLSKYVEEARDAEDPETAHEQMMLAKEVLIRYEEDHIEKPRKSGTKKPKASKDSDDDTEDKADKKKKKKKEEKKSKKKSKSKGIDIDTDEDEEDDDDDDSEDDD